MLSLRVLYIQNNFGRYRSVSNIGHFTLEAETVFRPYLPRIAAGWVRQHTVHSFLVVYKQCNFGRNHSPKKGTLLLRPKQFSIPISPGIAAGSVRQQTMHSLLILYKQCKFDRSRSSKKGTLLSWPKQFFLISPVLCSRVTKASYLGLHVYALQVLRFWSISVGNEGYFTLDAETVFRPCLASRCSGMTETARRAPITRHIQAVQVWSKSVRKKGHFTLKAKIFFPYLASYRGELTHTAHNVVFSRSVQADQVWA
jgi:hypothetical protein